MWRHYLYAHATARNSNEVGANEELWKMERSMRRDVILMQNNPNDRPITRQLMRENALPMRDYSFGGWLFVEYWYEYANVIFLVMHS